MAEYIEREAIEKFIENGLNEPDRSKAFGHDAIEILTEVHYMPAADVAPVVHGRWVHDGRRFKGGVDWCHCSECGGKNNFAARTNYCPNCGAKMDGGEPMTDNELLKALDRIRVETGSLVCLGCGHEHGCSVHGCAVLRAAQERLRAMNDKEERQ